MTISEVYQLFEGWELANMNSWRQAAFISANLMNLQLKKPVTVDQLLGLKKNRIKKSKDEMREEWEDLKTRL